jgi:peptide/nickel transport system ATP-binding protein
MSEAEVTGAGPGPDQDTAGQATAGQDAAISTTGAAGPTLAVEHLDVSYRVRGQDRLALRDVTFQIGRGESYGLVGESGSGKSTAALALTRYLPRNGRISAGEISINGMNPLAMGPAALRGLRARTVSMVYQEPGRALNPSIKVGRQVAEVFEIAGLGRPEALARAEAMLARVQIADPRRVMERYPHQLSGGMAQRAVIAMALAAEPSLLILDEPTTSLDATVEAEVLDLIESLRQELTTSVLFISHNLAVIARMCDRIGVLYAGELVEEGPADEVLRQPRHPYTVGLLRCVPRAGQRKDHGRLDTIPGFLPPPGHTLPGCVFAPRCPIAQAQCREAAPPAFVTGPGRTSRCYLHEAAADLPRNTPADLELVSERDPTRPVIRVEQLAKTFGSGAGAVRALTGVDLTLHEGETLGLVGESGSGKTTLARALLGLIAPDHGSVIQLDGQPLPADARRRQPGQLKALQIVFQNPDSALNRRHTVRRLISQPLARLAGLSGARLRERLSDLVRSVRMEDRHLPLRPSQLSGGLKQRVAIARAFAGGPRVVVCDEPTSALDVSVQAAILNLLVDLQAKEHVSYLFISHDLGLVRYLSDRIAVLYLGRLMEVGPAEDVFAGPHHPYTEALLSAVPRLDDERPGQTRVNQTRIKLQGEIPSAANPPSGCVFHTRCPRRLDDGSCESSEPPLREVAPGHLMSCHIPIDQLAALQAQQGGTQ